MNLLSFGEEAEAEEQAVETVKAKIKSSHDVLQDPRLLKDPVDSAEMVRILFQSNQDSHMLKWSIGIIVGSHVKVLSLVSGSS